MKKLLLSAALLSALAAVAEKAQPERTGPFRPAYDSPTSETFRRYEAVENTKGAGFYWIDSTRGDVWRIDSETKEWTFLGSPRGANTGPNGTYQLLADPKGGVYILNSEKGSGWWTDGTTWKLIGELSRRMKME